MKNWLFALSLFVSSSVAAEVKLLSEQGFVIKNEVETHIEHQAVWNALIDHVDLWWPKDHTWWGKDGTMSIAPTAGGCFCEFASGNRSAEHMRISFVEPGHLLRMTGGLGPLQGMGMFGALDWRLTTTDKVTKLTLTYTVQGFSAEGFDQLAPVVSKVQNLQLQALKTFVEQNETR